LYLQLLTVFCLTPGNAVAYAPHMIALGLLARLEPGSWRAFGLITAAIFALLLYGISCDPLWTTINGFSWSVAFAVVTLSPLKLKAIFVRGAALGCCLVLLLLTGALGYVYTLSQYTARVQFAAIVDRPRLVPFVSTAFYSSTAKYYYLACALGWLLGILALRGRPRVLVLAAATACVVDVVYSAGFILLNVPWTAPIPVYVEHSLFPLFLAAAVAGYWGALRAVASRLRQPVAAAIALSGVSVRKSALTMVQRVRIAAIRQGIPRVAHYLLPLSLLLDPNGAQTSSDALVEQAPSRIPSLQVRSKLPLQARLQNHFAPVVLSLVSVAILPAIAVDFAVNRSAPHAKAWYQPYPNQPELYQFLAGKAGRVLGQPFRGSVNFPLYNDHAGLTVTALWAKGIPTIHEYGQLVTAQSFYILYGLFQNSVIGNLNGFVPYPGQSWSTYLKSVQVLGAQYHVADAAGAAQVNKI